MNFTDPLAISQGTINTDKVMVSLKNPNLFVSKKTGKAISRANALAINDVPRQVASWVNLEALERQARASSVVFKALLVILLIVHSKLLSSNESMWTLFYFMQIVCYLKIYDTPFPANVEVYMN